MAVLVGILAVLEIGLLIAVLLLPAAVVVLRYVGGWKAALGVTVAIVAAAAGFGGIDGAASVAGYAGIGVLLAFFFTRTKSATQVFLGTYGCYAASIVAAMLAVTLAGPKNEAPAEEAARALAVAFVDQETELARATGRVDEVDLAVQRDRALYVVDRVMVALPAAIATGLALAVLLNMLVARDVLAARLVALPFTRLTEWRASEWLIWPVIAAGFGVLVGMLFGPGRWLYRPSLNVLVVALVPFLFQGLAITSHFLKRWGVPRWLRTLLWAFAVPQLWILATVPVGLFDVWLDIRGRSLRAEKKKDGDRPGDDGGGE